LIVDILHLEVLRTSLDAKAWITVVGVCGGECLSIGC
jgi:hypothetical protein